MKFKVNDSIIITSGKDKGKKATITRVLPRENKVVVDGINTYTRHVRKYAGQAGQKTVLSRPLSLAKIAILNDKGEPDRIGYKIAENGQKLRIFKKTGTVIAETKVASKDEKKAVKKDEKKVAKEVAQEAKAAKKAAKTSVKKAK